MGADNQRLNGRCLKRVWLVTGGWVRSVHNSRHQATPVRRASGSGRARIQNRRRERSRRSGGAALGPGGAVQGVGRQASRLGPGRAWQGSHASRIKAEARPHVRARPSASLILFIRQQSQPLSLLHQLIPYLPPGCFVCTALPCQPVRLLVQPRPETRAEEPRPDPGRPQPRAKPQHRPTPDRGRSPTPPARLKLRQNA